MRSRLGIAVAVLLAVCSMASADLVSLTGSGGSTSDIVVQQSSLSQTLTFEVWIDSSVNLTGASFRLQSLDGPDIFQLVNISFNETGGWGFAGWGPGQAYYGEDPELIGTFLPIDLMTSAPDGSSSEDLFAFSMGDYVPAGTGQFATLTVELLGDVAVGSYELNLANLVLSDANGYDIEEGFQIGNAMTVVVTDVIPIPAPPAVWLAGMGLVFAARMRKRLTAVA